MITMKNPCSRPEAVNAYQEQAIEQILKDTHGEYDLVVRELEVLINQGFSQFAELAGDDVEEPETEDLGY